jgi:3-oxoadipate enol-lactonase
MDWVETNGVCLRYELAGDQPQTVLLVHELGGALDSFDECVGAFQQHFRTLRYDQRGFGHSEKVRGAITMSDMVADIIGLLDSLGITEPVHATGAGVGGGLALALAARHPHRVARLVVGSPATFIPPELHERLVARAALVEKEGMRCFADVSLALSYPEVLRGNRARFEKYRRRWLSNDPYCFAAINRMHMNTNLEPELTRYGPRR